MHDIVFPLQRGPCGSSRINSPALGQGGSSLADEVIPDTIKELSQATALAAASLDSVFEPMNHGFKTTSTSSKNAILNGEHFFWGKGSGRTPADLSDLYSLLCSTRGTYNRIRYISLHQ